MTLGIVEVIGPARLALTVAMTPAVSGKVREWEWVREVEGSIQKRVEGLISRLPGRKEK